MKSIRFGLTVIAVCGLIVLGTGIRIALWAHQAQALDAGRDALLRQRLALQQTVAALYALEARERSYVSTGDVADLPAYRKAGAELAEALRGLGEGSGSTGAADGEIMALAQLARARQDESVRAIERRRSAGSPAAPAGAAPQGSALAAFPLRFAAAQDRLAVLLAGLARERSALFWDISALSAVAVLVVDLLVVVAIVSLSVAIHQMRDEQQEQSRQAMHDPLTVLPNRRYLVDWLTMSLAAARRRGQPLALLYIDLDGFKTINDRFGHDAGDRVLRITATRLRRALRQSDFVARLGGDEFVAVLREAPTPEGLSALIERLQAAIAKAPIAELDDGALQASIGAAWFPTDGQALDTLLAAADRAMYHVKEAHHARLAAGAARSPMAAAPSQTAAG